MKEGQITYTEIPAGNNFPDYSDYKLARDLNFQLAYNKVSSGGFPIGAVLHLPTGWTAVIDTSSTHHKLYNLYNQNGYRRGTITYIYSELNPDSHTIAEPAMLKVNFCTRFEFCVVSYAPTSRLELTDWKAKITYQATQTYSSFDDCNKKLQQQAKVLKVCLPRSDDPRAYWGSQDALLDTFFQKSKFTWVKKED